MRAPDFDNWPRKPMDVEHHDSLRVTPLKSVSSGMFMGFAATVLSLVDHTALGLRIEGKEHVRELKNSGAVVICNHVHWLDCTMLALAVFPRRQHFVTLQSNMEMHGIRHILRLGRCIPVPEDRHKLRQLYDNMNTALKAGGIVHIYPEGHLEPYCKELRDFKKGAFSMARDAGVPILPMRIVYRKPRGVWRLKRRPCLTLKVLKPVYPDMALSRADDIKRLRDECRAEMESAPNKTA